MFTHGNEDLIRKKIQLKKKNNKFRKFGLMQKFSAALLYLVLACELYQWKTENTLFYIKKQ